MGHTNSTHHNHNKKKSYDAAKYKPTKNGQVSESLKNVEIENNNNTSSVTPRSLYYRITKSIHREILDVTLENGSTAKEHYISPLQMSVMFETESRLHFKITDPNSPRFEVRYEEMRKTYPKFIKRAQQTNYDLELSGEEEPFALTVTRRSTGFPVFDMRKDSIHYEDEKLSIAINLHTQHIYGFGEHQKKFLIDTSEPHNFVFWAGDHQPQENANLCGVHPFFLGLEDDGNAFGVFLLNSCAMEVEITPEKPYNKLRYTMNGGILDFFVFTGPSPVEVIQQYQELIGRPHLPPYWALGYHLSAWGYETAEELHNVIQRTRRTGIPYECQWTDIDLMNDKQSWTFKSAKMKHIIEDLQRNGQRYVPIVDPGVSISHNQSAAYADGLKADIFVKNYSGVRPLVGKCWPGDVVFPDFSNPDVEEYWLKQAKSLHDQIPFDGLWLDMNEPSNFVGGCSEDCKLTDKHTKDFPKFVPEKLKGKVLFEKTVCPSAQHHRGLHYHLHNLYGHLQMHITDKVLTTLKKKRCLIISRSTFAGSGHYGGHWTGDNDSTFRDLRASIPALLDFNLFGIPLVGADIGGFSQSCNEELMIRWTQLGAFYPFMRNHNSHPEQFGSTPQDPAQYSNEAQDIMRTIVLIRYSLLPYLYTLLHENHVKDVSDSGNSYSTVKALSFDYSTIFKCFDRLYRSPVVRPLFMHFPRDKATYSIDTQFMWGNALLISPCVLSGHITVEAYFPFDVWFDFYSGIRLQRVGTTLTLPAPLQHMNIHVRGGSIIPTQAPDRNTTYSRRNPFSLLIALDSKHQACGQLYWDDGDVLEPIDQGRYNLIKFYVKENKLTSAIMVHGYRDAQMMLGMVQIFGLYVQPSKVILNGLALPFTYTEKYNVLQVTFNQPITLLHPIHMEW